MARSARQEDPLPLALVRVLVCGATALDLQRAAQLHLVTVLWRTYEAGGLSRFSGKRAQILDESSHFRSLLFPLRGHSSKIGSTELQVESIRQTVSGKD